MTIVLYIAGVVAILSALMVITRTEAVHALLYLVVSLLSLAVIFFVIGAAFAAALQVIIYAGAIVVLFIFSVILLNRGEPTAENEKAWLASVNWAGPAALTLILLGTLVFVLLSSDPVGAVSRRTDITASAVGQLLFGPYVLAVELVSFLLLSGLIGAYHLGRRDQGGEQEREGVDG